MMATLAAEWWVKSFVISRIGGNEVRRCVVVVLARRVKPPMCFTQADADFLCDALDLALSEL